MPGAATSPPRTWGRRDERIVVRRDCHASTAREQRESQRPLRRAPRSEKRAVISRGLSTAPVLSGGIFGTYNFEGLFRTRSLGVPCDVGEQAVQPKMLLCPPVCLPAVCKV